MLFTSPEQFLVLALVLLVGWLFGYASAPNPKKWKRRLREQTASFTAYSQDADDRLRAAHQRAADLNAEIEALRADHVDAERTIADLRAAAPPRPGLALVAAPLAEEVVAEPTETPAAPIEEAEAEPRSATVDEDAPAPEDVIPAPAPDEPPAIFPMTPPPTVAEPAPIGRAEPPVPAKGWLASSARDDLTRIRGIDGVLSTRLFGLGVVLFEDIEKLSAQDEMALETRLALPVGTIARDQWRPQAALLRAGQDAEHAAQFGAVEA